MRNSGVNLAVARFTHMTAPMCETWTVRGLQACETTARDRNRVADRTSVHRSLVHYPIGAPHPLGALMSKNWLDKSNHGGVSIKSC